MNSPELYSPNPDSLLVATWNILLDYTRTDSGIIKSQADRLPSQVKTLEELRAQLGIDLDAVAIQEAHKDSEHNGERLSNALGYGIGQWVEHNKKPYPGSKTGRKGEHVGLFGARIDHSEPIELGDNRRAILSNIGEVAIAGIHTRADRTGRLQLQQTSVAVEKLSGYDQAVLMGDFNNLPGSRARKLIENTGFKSAVSGLNRWQLGTWPTREYRKIMLGSKAQHVVPSVQLDDIYVRGLAVVDAGTFVGDSDHAGLWARLVA